ncbi:MAG: acetylglutamate kinase [Planctomycetes bacterium]|nr:acetylglutamate kinase [Planctomycetota bacterium]
MAEPRLSAEAFAAAVKRITEYRARPVVVKLGGSAMEDPVATDSCLRSVATLNALGVPLVLVHGGGKPIDRAMAEAGLTPKKVAGRRYTDDATLAIVVRVLHEINRDLVARLCALGIQTFEYCDAKYFPLSGDPLVLTGSDAQPIDLGRVGMVRYVHAELFRAPEHGPSLVVLPSLAVDGEGGWLNVNADTAASAVAGALKADKAIFLTDTPGVLRDRANPASLIPSLTEREARDLIAAGVIDGGMVPKVEACFEALEAGADAALILDGRAPYSLLDVFLHDTFKGTAIRR